MGFWRGLAYALDRQMAEEADRRQAAYDANFGGGFGGGASRRVFAGKYWWRDNEIIQRGNSPHNGPNHVPGCTCRFCMRGFIANGFRG